jgi:DNA polymerase-3 subunit gamma/tau
MRQNQRKTKKPFHSKYRPNTFGSVTGQEHIVSYFKNAITKQSITFAYLFIGKHGVGKTTLSRLVAKALNCPKFSREYSYEPCNNCTSCISISIGSCFDVYEINAAMNTGVDSMRDIIEKIQLSPVDSLYKVCIIDEVHMLSQNAFNAILKILEEPPKNVVFILATTDVKKIPSTIVSRCHKLHFLSLSQRDLSIAITRVIWLEGGNVTDKALKHILNFSQGSFRDALTIIDMLMIDNTNINQSRCSFMAKEIPYSLSELLFNYLLEKNIKKILHVFNYLEYKGWIELGLIDYLAKSLTQSITENNYLYSYDNYVIDLWQLLLRHSTSVFTNFTFFSFVADLISLLNKQTVTNNLSFSVNKKLVPKITKMKVVYEY